MTGASAASMVIRPPATKQSSVSARHDKPPSVGAWVQYMSSIIER
jgi:hypothetical protein